MTDQEGTVAKVVVEVTDKSAATVEGLTTIRASLLCPVPLVPVGFPLCHITSISVHSGHTSLVVFHMGGCYCLAGTDNEKK